MNLRGWTSLFAAPALLFVFAGCSMFMVGESGPITVVLGSEEGIIKKCLELTPPARKKESPKGGCTEIKERGNKDHFTIHCPFNNARCIAHEIRHIVEPGWTHHDVETLIQKTP